MYIYIYYIYIYIYIYVYIYSLYCLYCFVKRVIDRKINIQSIYIEKLNNFNNSFVTLIFMSFTIFRQMSDVIIKITTSNLVQCCLDTKALQSRIYFIITQQKFISMILLGMFVWLRIINYSELSMNS